MLLKKSLNDGTKSFLMMILKKVPKKFHNNGIKMV